MAEGDWVSPGESFYTLSISRREDRAMIEGAAEIAEMGGVLDFRSIRNVGQLQILF